MLAVSASQTMLENEDTSGLHRFTIQRSWCNLFQCPLEKVSIFADKAVNIDESACIRQAATNFSDPPLGIKADLVCNIT